MNYHNKESIQKTQESYLQAASKAIDLFGNLRRAGGGYTYFIGETMSAANSDKNMKHATNANVTINSLFDYGNPRLLPPSYTIWRAGFLEFKLWWRHPFTVYSYHNREVWRTEDGEVDRIVEAGLRHSKETFSVLISDRSFGINDVTERPHKIHEWISQCENEEIRDYMLEKLKEAKEEVHKWREAIQEIQTGAQPVSNM